MKLGFHISISGGLKNVCKRALIRNCETIQVFSRNPRGWDYKELNDEDCTIFKEQITANDITPVFVHLPYLINLGSNNIELYKKSIASLIEDLKRAEKIGAQFLISHSGSNPDLDEGIEKMIQAIKSALSTVDNRVIILIENTAGGGNEFGYAFEHIKKIIDGVNSNRIGMVFDTAHAFAAGYELRTEKGVDETLGILDRLVGLRRVHLVHFNDSMAEFGSRKDRHWHIGKGKIGKGMGFIINHPKLKHLPFIMETPRNDTEEDLMNMDIARKLIKNP
jgi:deoxyribonuclease-4|uniref:Probable endonuclease 4 n=1 Tax=candidate division WOR-3 bacterium TaxID=2052148 RepID=A0A7V3RJ12_UNCW3